MQTEEFFHRLSNFQFCNSSVYLLLIGICDFSSQYNTSLIELELFFFFPFFGLAHNHLNKFEFVGANFLCEFIEERFFQNFLFRDVVTLTFNGFSNVLSDSPTLIHRRDSSVGSFQFRFGILRVFVLVTLSDCHLTVLRYGFGIAQSFASNVKLSSEIQIYVMCIGCTATTGMTFGFRQCRIFFQVLPITYFGMPDL